MDNFKILGINKQEHLDRQYITDTYEQMKQIYEKKLEKMMRLAGVAEKNYQVVRYGKKNTHEEAKIKMKIEVNSKDISLTEEQKQQIETMQEELNILEQAYWYTVKEDSICLRKYIMEASKQCSTQGITRLREKEFNMGNKASDIRVMNKGKELQTYDATYYEIDDTMDLVKRKDIIFQNGTYTDDTLKQYTILLKEQDKQNGYSFYAGTIGVELLKDCPEYKRMILQSVEKMRMEGNGKYIGIPYELKDGNYAMVIDMGQKEASRKLEENRDLMKPDTQQEKGRE